MPGHRSPLLIATLLALLSTPPALARKPLDPAQEHDLKLLALIEKSLGEGLAVVLIPNPHDAVAKGDLGVRPGSIDFYLRDTIVDRTPVSTQVIWRNRENASVGFLQSFPTNTLEENPKAVYLGETFEVQVIPAGTYLLSGAVGYQLDSPLPKPTGKPAAASKGPPAIGTVRLRNVDFEQAYLTRQWSPGYVTSTDHSRTYCTTVRVVSGECTATAKETYTTQQAHAGMYVDAVKQRKVVATRLETEIPALQAPASFTVAAGQLVVASHVSVGNGGIGIDSKRCRTGPDKAVDCPLQQLTFHVKPISARDARFTLLLNTPYRAVSKKMLQRMKNIDSLQVDLIGTTGPVDPVFGTPVTTVFNAAK
ncbi:hypothetical protein ABE473_14035 [Stenotrophomonas sp. TWI700]|uniref:hypothetical protein n=1 Tax=Stenotrophomonas sp. TWI700 TaxID=3136792 RepID=UPI0032093B1E